MSYYVDATAKKPSQGKARRMLELVAEDAFLN
jgi:hypothetical protein